MPRIASAAIAAATLLLGSATARAATEIDFFFPVPVQGRLSNEIQRLVSEFNAAPTTTRT
jgi:sn-glycerol 3-phosphate transport system substrate-binding protein